MVLFLGVCEIDDRGAYDPEFTLEAIETDQDLKFERSSLRSNSSEENHYWDKKVVLLSMFETLEINRNLIDQVFARYIAEEIDLRDLHFDENSRALGED